jgi:hypothetical protein
MRGTRIPAFACSGRAVLDHVSRGERERSLLSDASVGGAEPTELAASAYAVVPIGPMPESLGESRSSKGW